MKKRSIILASVMGVALTVSGVAAATLTLNDVPKGHWAEAAVKWAQDSQLVQGYTDNTFRGDNNMTRYEVVQVFSKYNTMMEKKMTDMQTKMDAMEKMMTDMQTKMDAMEKMMGQTTVMYMAALDGKQEVPAVDTTATGTASFELSGSKLTYTIEVKDLSGAVTAAHIHMGKAGEEGAPVHTITFDGMKAAGSWTMTEAEMKNLKDGMYYVNVHTAKNAEGEIRGQIVPKA